MLCGECWLLFGDPVCRNCQDHVLEFEDEQSNENPQEQYRENA